MSSSGTGGSVSGFTINVPGASGNYGGTVSAASGRGGSSGMGWGAGGYAIQVAGNGSPGSNYGGGGAGGHGAASSGGAGAQGAILVEYWN